MNAHLFEFTCASCGTTFRDVGMLAPSGRLILRGEGTGVAIAVDTWSDPVFQDVRDLVASLAPDGLAPPRACARRSRTRSRHSCVLPSRRVGGSLPLGHAGEWLIDRRS